MKGIFYPADTNDTLSNQSVNLLKPGGSIILVQQ